MKAVALRWLCCAGVLMALGVASHAQGCMEGGCDVWVGIELDVNDGCTCAIGVATFDWDSTAEIAYTMITNSEMYDSGTQASNYDQSDTAYGNVYEDYYEDDNEPMGDEYYIDANISATLTPQYYQCETGACGQFCQLQSGGGTWCPSIMCPSGEMEYSQGDSGNASLPGNSCGSSDEDTLINEYQFPSSYGISVPAGSQLAWVPGCGDLVSSNPTPYGAAFSGGDITDWAAFQSPMLGGLSQINNTVVPPAAQGSAPAQPVPITGGTDEVYRTPVENSHVSPTLPEEPHQFGLAIDFASSNLTTWGNTAAWAEWATGSSPGHILGNVCVEPFSVQGNYGHVHVDWRPEVPKVPQCPLPTWEVSIPASWPSH